MQCTYSQLLFFYMVHGKCIDQVFPVHFIPLQEQEQEVGTVPHLFVLAEVQEGVNERQLRFLVGRLEVKNGTHVIQEDRMASCENFQGFLLVIRGKGGISGEKGGRMRKWEQ